MTSTKKAREFYWDGGMIIQDRPWEDFDYEYEWHLIEYSAYNALETENKQLKEALSNAVNQLSGIPLMLKAHGQNINVKFVIDTYEKFANNAKNVLEQK